MTGMPLGVVTLFVSILSAVATLDTVVFISFLRMLSDF